MAYYSLKAQIFVGLDGVAITKAPPVSRKIAKLIYERDGGICCECGCKTRFGGREVHPFQKIASGAIDHIIPRSRGGQNSLENPRLLCMSCNSKKGAK